MISQTQSAAQKLCMAGMAIAFALAIITSMSAPQWCSIVLSGTRQEETKKRYN